jgi:nitronate monooxygenase
VSLTISTEAFTKNHHLRSTAHDDIQGTGFWPAIYDGRAIIGKSYEDFTSGIPISELVEQHKATTASGDNSRKIIWW